MHVSEGIHSSQNQSSIADPGQQINMFMDSCSMHLPVMKISSVQATPSEVRMRELRELEL